MELSVELNDTTRWKPKLEINLKQVETTYFIYAHSSSFVTNIITPKGTYAYNTRRRQCTVSLKTL